MKITRKWFLGGLLMAGLFVAAPSAISAEKDKGGKSEKTEKKGDKYPLDTCVVSDEKLGSMGDPVVVKLEGKEVKLCCKSCQKELKKDSAKYLKKLEDAEKKAKKK